MKPLPASSGDLIADRRADYAEMLFANGEHAAAAELMLGALELTPEWAMGWFRLGEFQQAAGALDAAERAWRMTLQLEPADRPGSALKLQLIGAAPAADAPPSAFVETLFDQYAEKFDEALVTTLGYRGPELIAHAIRAAAPGRRFGHAVDLGCGTGLMGERLRPFADCLEGHDISAAMLRKAEARKVYDRLVRSDLQQLALEARSADLVTAADVFIYVGALERVVATIGSALSPGGLFAFSVENHDGLEDFCPSRNAALCAFGDLCPQPAFTDRSCRHVTGCGHDTNGSQLARYRLDHSCLPKVTQWGIWRNADSR